MTTSMIEKQRLLSNLTLNSNAPIFCKERQEQALNLLNAAPVLSAKIEAWKYIDLTELLDSNLTQVDANLEINTEHVNAIAFNDSTGTDAELINSTFQDMTDKSNPFRLLNVINSKNGTFFHVTGEKKAEVTINLSANDQKSAVSYNQFVCKIDDGASAVFKVYLGSNIDNVSLLSTVFDFSLGKEAQCDVLFLHDDVEVTNRFNHLYAKLDKKSRFNACFLNKEGRLIRHDATVDFIGEEADSILAGMANINGETQSFSYTRVNHIVPSCTSNQVFKNILDGKSRSEYNGLVYVMQDSQKTDSRQNNKNLLLSDDARALARPQLEIFADDVECAHGSSTGQLDDYQLFYLMSRGIDKESAQKTLLKGFIDEVLDEIHNEDLRNVAGAYFK